MAPLALALFLFLQGQPAAEAAAQPVAEAPGAVGAAPETAPEDRWPAGAPHDDYQFVSWCYGNLRAYLDLHDRVMPEVTRIESTYRPPDRKLSDDLKVYADMQKEGRGQLKSFQAAMTAAEKASLRPLNVVGAGAVAKGRDVWRMSPDVTPARLAQAWMSWALPARCDTTAKDLQAKATLLGASFKVNDEPETTAADAPTPAPADALLPPTTRADPAAAAPAPEPATPQPQAPAAPAETAQPPAPAPSPN